MRQSIQSDTPSLFTEGREYLEFMSGQVMVVDPRAQGFGLREQEALDAYANKFLPLSGKNGVFASPAAIPDELLDYYDTLDVDIAPRERIVNVGSGPTESSVIQRLAHNQTGQQLLRQRCGEFVVPYMVTSEVEDFAALHRLQVLASSAAVDRMGDKAQFQHELSLHNDEIREETGFDVAIRTAPVFRASDQSSAKDAYDELSEAGRHDVMIVKPKSASALGVFVARAAMGEAGFHAIVDQHFNEDDEVLLEEYVRHTHSPSMQGVNMPGSDYRHLYFGAQLLSKKDDVHIQYDGNEIPFGHAATIVRPEELARVRQLHELLGERIMKRQAIHGIGGFDAVMNITDTGRIKDLKITELNLHLPGSSAVYAAVAKLFPDGFEGIARNWRQPLKSQDTPEAFLARNKNLLVPEQQSYGLFPVNMSYKDQIDIIALASNTIELEQLTERIIT